MLRSSAGEAVFDYQYDVSVSKMGASAQRVIDRAISHARRLHHSLLTNEHIFLAFARLESQLFSHLMQEAGVAPQRVVREVREHLSLIPPGAGREQRVAPATKLLFKLAFHHACRAGRQTITSIDLFSAIFEESQGITVAALRRHGGEIERVWAVTGAWIRDEERRRAESLEAARRALAEDPTRLHLDPGDSLPTIAAAEILERAKKRVAAEEEEWERQVAATRREARPGPPPSRTKIFEEAAKRVATEEASKARAWPGPPRTLRRRLLDLMGFRRRTKA